MQPRVVDQQSARSGPALLLVRQTLERGGILAVPTESSYALAVDPRSRAGVEAIYSVKERDRGKPLPVVVARDSQAHALGVALDDPGLVAARPFWPAALSVVVPVARPMPATAGGTTLAIRVPGHGGLRKLLGKLGHALTATSANRSKEPSLCRSSELVTLLSGVDATIVDGGTLPGGLPSTMVSWCRSSARFRVIRRGRLELE